MEPHNVQVAGAGSPDMIFSMSKLLGMRRAIAFLVSLPFLLQSPSARSAPSGQAGPSRPATGPSATKGAVEGKKEKLASTRASPAVKTTKPSSAVQGKTDGTKKEVGCRPCRCKPCRKRKIILGFSGGIGGFYSRTTRWVRNDGFITADIGVKVHSQVVVQVAFRNSAERYAHMLRIGGLWFPLGTGPFARLSFDLSLIGAGVQPGLSTGAGYALFFRFPLGLFAEAEMAGRLTAPKTLELNVLAGIFTHF